MNKKQRYETLLENYWEKYDRECFAKIGKRYFAKEVDMD